LFSAALLKTSGFPDATTLLRSDPACDVAFPVVNEYSDGRFLGREVITIPAGAVATSAEPHFSLNPSKAHQGQSTRKQPASQIVM
jgi:hypothetical protein